MDPFYQGFHGCMGNTPWQLSCHTSREHSSKCPSLHQGKKRAVPHGQKSLLMDFVSHSRAPNTSALITDSCLYHRQDRAMKNKTTDCSKRALYPLHDSLHKEWFFSVWNYNMMVPANKLCSNGLCAEHFSPSIFQNCLFVFLSHLHLMCAKTHVTRAVKKYLWNMFFAFS